MMFVDNRNLFGLQRELCLLSPSSNRSVDKKGIPKTPADVKDGVVFVFFLDFDVFCQAVPSSACADCECCCRRLWSWQMMVNDI